ncbi:alpha-hydroxy acid oxidase [Pelosinus sp. sgz500959]|uniref:alpha-hydroxy acid oxidase n=1 Tax=Pelosinus sp. sgz500959 TaxID=3242472 RepID=UPI00366FF767
MIGKLLTEGNEKLRELGLSNFLSTGVETGSVLKITRDYLDSLTIETRMIDAVLASTEMTLFGQKFDTPVMTAPLSSLGAICPNPMVELAKGAKKAGAVMWVGIGQGEELKAIIETGAKTIKIIKPYKDNELILDKIAEAEKYGAFAVGMDIIFFFGGKIGDSVLRSDLMGPKTLAEIKSFVQTTKLPFVLKGVLSEQDARKALEVGAAAIVVSHHGGSTLDYAVPPLKILPSIAKVIDGKIPIFVDSGISRGTDVFKALALGASGVLIGRTAMAGLAVGAAEGAEKIITGTNEELRRVMNLTGSLNLQQIDSKLIWY